MPSTGWIPVVRWLLTIMISVQIVSRGEATLSESMESVSRYLKDVCEVLVIQEGSEIATLAGYSPTPFHIKVPPGTGLLEARAIGVERSHGDHCLLLDSTRMALPGAGDELLELAARYDAAALGEVSRGAGYWVRMAEVDKAITSNRTSAAEALATGKPYVLPRMFRRDRLMQAILELRELIDPRVFSRITYGDHLLITYQFTRHAPRVGMSSRPVLAHYEDETASRILKKYHRYGRSQRLLRSLRGFEEVTRLSRHRRVYSGIPTFDRLRVQPLYWTRTVSFLIGYLGL